MLGCSWGTEEVVLGERNQDAHVLLTSRQLRALSARARRPGLLVSDYRRGAASACEWLASQMRECAADSGRLDVLLRERFESAGPFHTQFGCGYASVLADVGAILGSDGRATDRVESVRLFLLSSEVLAAMAYAFVAWVVTAPALMAWFNHWWGTAGLASASALGAVIWGSAFLLMCAGPHRMEVSRTRLRLLDLQGRTFFQIERSQVHSVALRGLELWVWEAQGTLKGARCHYLPVISHFKRPRAIRAVRHALERDEWLTPDPNNT